MNHHFACMCTGSVIGSGEVCTCQPIAFAVEQSYDKGYAAALDAAREAVAALLAYESPMGPLVRTEAALAAIDALRGES